MRNLKNVISYVNMECAMNKFLCVKTFIIVYNLIVASNIEGTQLTDCQRLSQIPSWDVFE